MAKSAVATRVQSEVRSANTTPVGDSSPSKSGAKVTVACKIPAGLELRTGKFVTRTVQAHNGTVQERIWVPDGRTVRLLGNRRPFGVSVPGITGETGFGLTHNIDKDFWDAWLAENKDSDYVKNGFVFAVANKADAASKARELADTFDGLGPLNPETRREKGREVPVDDRWPRRGRNISAVKTAQKPGAGGDDEDE